MAKAVTSYLGARGGLYTNLSDAVASEVQEELDSWFVDPLSDSHLIAKYLCADPDKRERLRTLLAQLDRESS